MHAFGRSLDGELETFLRGLRLEVGSQPLEHLVDREGGRIRRHAAAVELADVEHGREQRGHRVERQLLPLEQAEHGGVRAGLALRCAVQQVQGLERLAQVVARGREEPALLPVLGDELVFFVAPQRRVANGRDDEQAFVRRDGAQADLDRKFVAVLVAAVERAAGAHRARLRMRREALAMAGMCFSETLRQQSFDPCADELRGAVAERVLDLGVREHDRAVGVDDDGRVGRQIEQRSGQLAREVHSSALDGFGAGRDAG